MRNADKIPTRTYAPRIYLARCICCGMKIAGRGEFPFPSVPGTAPAGFASDDETHVYCATCDVFSPSTGYVMNHEDQTWGEIAHEYA